MSNEFNLRRLFPTTGPYGTIPGLYQDNMARDLKIEVQS